MSKQESLFRHKIIIQKLRSKPCTFDDISNKLQEESHLHDMDLQMSIRTFQRDVKDIQALYNIEIRYNRSKKVYEISEDDNEEFNERIFEALDTFQALNLGQTYSEFIEFDTRKALGSEYLSGLLHAIQNRIQITFRYKKFRADETEIRRVEPYLLKEFKRRWYIFAYDVDKKEFRIFGLDRMKALQFENKHFQYPQEINPKEFFKDSFGIISPGRRKPRKIELEFINDQGNYIRTLPLHHSQKIISDKEGVTRVTVELVPTYDFIMELVSHGEDLRVIKPKSLAKEIVRKLEKMQKLYPQN